MTSFQRTLLDNYSSSITLEDKLLSKVALFNSDYWMFNNYTLFRFKDLIFIKFGDLFGA